VTKAVYFEVLREVLDLIGCCEQNDSIQIVRKMKQIVPEFLSKNSSYELLDAKAGKEKNALLINA
jgi:hypothetical protein